jgi:hypothetical protein
MIEEQFGWRVAETVLMHYSGYRRFTLLENAKACKEGRFFD